MNERDLGPLVEAAERGASDASLRKYDEAATHEERATIQLTNEERTRRGFQLGTDKARTITESVRNLQREEQQTKADRVHGLIAELESAFMDQADCNTETARANRRLAMAKKALIAEVSK